MIGERLHMGSAIESTVKNDALIIEATNGSFGDPV